MKTPLLGLLFLSFVACQGTAPSAGEPAKAVDASATVAAPVQYAGFTTIEVDGRWVVFRDEDPELAGYRKHGDLVKSVTRVGAGPGGRTLRAPDAETIDAFVLSRPGFVTRVQDNRVWVFAAGSKDWQDFLAHGEPAKSVTRIGVGPDGRTVKSSDAAVLDAWLAAL